MEESVKIFKNEYMRKYREANKEKLKAYRKEWFSKHPGIQKEYQDRYWKKKAELHEQNQ